MNQTVVTGRGRRVEIDVTGNPDGFPVFLLHGTPGSRLGPKPRGIELYHQGVRLICYDRPGYGGSTRKSGRTVTDVAHDVRAVADALDAERFAVVGRSGGAPHALACAALLPDRVLAAAALVTLAPRNAQGLDWFEGMAMGNVEAYTMLERDPDELEALLRDRSEAVRSNPELMLPVLDDGLEPSDRRIIGGGGIRRQLLETYRMAVQLQRGEDAYGWFDDVRALGNPSGWGFDPADIDVPVMLWHGREDRFSPASHTRWLAERISSSVLSIEPAASHFSAFPALPRLLGRLLDLAAVKAGAELVVR